MSTPANEVGFGQRTPQTVLRYKREDVQAALTIYTMQKEENLVNELSKLTSLYMYLFQMCDTIGDIAI